MVEVPDPIYAALPEIRRQFVAGQPLDAIAAETPYTVEQITEAISDRQLSELRLHFLWRQMMGLLADDLAPGERSATARVMLDAERARIRLLGLERRPAPAPTAERIDPRAEAIAAVG